MTFSSLEHSISFDNPIRFIDAFVEHIDLEALAFVVQTLKTEGRPSFDTKIKSIHLSLSSDNTNPSEKVLSSTKKRANTNASKKAETKPFFRSKEKEPIVKTTPNAPIAVAKVAVKYVHLENNVVGKQLSSKN